MGTNKYLKLACIGIFIGLTGCASLHSNIKYDLDDVKESTNKQLKEVILDIRAFEDVRKSVPENAILFSESYDDFYLKVGEAEYCVNKENIYSLNKMDVPSQISVIISKHLDKKGLFKSVTASNKVIQPAVNEDDSSDMYSEDTDKVKPQKVEVQEKIPADYYLSGKLRKFYGQHEYVQGSKGAALVFGAIGSLGAMSIEKPLMVEIEFVDLAVYRNDGQLLAEIGSLYEKFEEQETGANRCENIYYRVNEKLRHVVDKLADKIETAMTNKISG
ncbi:MAG: hypothetical protein OEZ51_14225 [Nitrospinota bacterium]|nr:hypothetical protein [Nitrospinota bacterium]